MIDVKRLFDTVGMKFDVEEQMDLSGYEYDGIYPFVSPIKIYASLSNRAGIVALNSKVEFVATFNCDRCLKDFEQKFELTGEFTLVEEANDELDEDKYIIVSNGELDLQESALNLILLNMPSKHLCKQDCEGLCYKCGKDLNEGQCNCSIN